MRRAFFAFFAVEGPFYEEDAAIRAFHGKISSNPRTVRVDTRHNFRLPANKDLAESFTCTIPGAHLFMSCSLTVYVPLRLFPKINTPSASLFACLRIAFNY